MTYTVETVEGTHPAHPEWQARATKRTAKAAYDYATDQMTDSAGRETTFGRNGWRIVDAEGREILHPQSGEVVYGNSQPYTVAA